MRRRWWVVAAAVIVGAGLLGAGAVMAQTATPGATGSSFLDRVAQKLGIQTSTLKDAVNSAAIDEIDARVQSGDLTQQQGDKLKQRIANGQGPGLGGRFLGGGHGKGPGFGFAFGIGKGGLATDGTKLADFLHITPDALMTELQADNATLATVAAAHGKSRDELKNFLSDETKARLDQAVTDQKLTQQQADDALSKLTANLDQLIDHPMPHFGGMRHAGPDDDNAPNGAATPGTGTRLPLIPSQRSTTAITSAVFHG